MSPITLFNDWHKIELELNTLKFASACCLSTIGLDGYPNARFVSLKKIIEDSFLIVGSLTSKKGLELQYCNKASLTFWFPFTQKQIRIQGDVHFVTNEEADRCFQLRPREEQLIALVSEQSEEIYHPEILQIKYSQAAVQFKKKPIPRPLSWGGFLLKPIRMEFFSFKNNGFPNRILFTKVQHLWETKILQP
ncbi:MAG: pyridoxal 5'-phosphate synthase [Candidatus Pedobacter colombiensis]|uniref:Pyridoxal 5'-phosphate synthase n=1 Tax=Candidatus Pedobacter colombiensis TaxID=3121371 RepID=A0AAJ5WCV3_9SPHI|nr:pyridoxal 5'-phosphate synthase [Pedobacter sp.]WEK21733.1 MAG: pyridoxal 5'-phosphate synthase [Pedobacter sp.]